MTRKLLVTTVRVVLTVALPAAFAACADSAPDVGNMCAGIELPDPPTKVNLLLVADGTSTDPGGSGLVLSYGSDPFIAACTLDADCASGAHCDRDLCSPRIGTCLDADGQTPIAMHATARAGASDIHIVFQRVVASNTVETDQGVLLPGVVTVRCGSFLTHTNGLAEGSFYSGGNIFPSADIGYAGIGPHISFRPSVDLPTGTDCTVELASSVKSIVGEPFTVDGPPRFHTGSFAVSSFGPVAADSAQQAYSILFNTNVLPSSIGPRAGGAANLAVTDAQGHDVAATVTVDGREARFAFVAGVLAPGASYTVTIAGRATDSYGIPLGSEQHFTFVASP